MARFNPHLCSFRDNLPDIKKGEAMFSGTAPTLRVESVSGLPINDYRIRGRQVEVRTFSSLERKPVPARAARPMMVPWRTLSEEEILIHLSLKTPVAAWLKRRMESRLGPHDFMDLVL